MLRSSPLISLVGLAVTVAATLDPATSNTKGKYPENPSCSPSETSEAIQAAECAHNTRVGSQTFAVFVTDHQYDDVYGAPYGTCEAYECASPASGEMASDSDYWTFFWSGEGETSGVGTGCIRSPDDGECGCEDSDGTFHPGEDDCV